MSENEKNIEEIVQKAVSKAIRKNSLISNGISWLLSLALICGVFYIWQQIKPKPVEVTDVEDHDLTLENNGIFGYTAVDFEDVILGQATRQKLLIVDEQEVSVTSTITSAGLFNWSVFSKAQNETIYGVGEYTIDLSEIKKEDIEFDEENYTVTIHVPYPDLHKVTFDPSKTQIGDTDKGWLAFGDIKLTAEQRKEYEVKANELLGERLNEEECFEKAARFAKLSAYEVYQPLVSSVSPAYKVEIVVKEKPANQE